MSNPFSRPLEQLKVTELREELRKRGLSLKGVKKELFERLHEAVRKEQLLDGSGATEDAHDGEHETVGPEGIASNQDEPPDESICYPNEAENSMQDNALIVNNASPYVGASDATSVFMKPWKTLEAVLEGHSRDTEEHNVDHTMEETGNVAAEGDNGHIDDVRAADTIEPVLDNQGNENDASLKQSVGNGTGLPETGNQGGNNNTVPESDIQADITMVAETDSILGISPDVENLALAQESGPSASFNWLEAVRQSVGGENVADVSISDRYLCGPDARIPSMENAVVANDCPVEDGKVFEKTNLTSVSVAPCVQGEAEDQDGVSCKEGTSVSELQGMNPVEPYLTLEDKSVLETLDHLHVAEVLKETSVAEAAEHMPLSKDSIADTVIQEATEDLVKQEENRDVSMSEPDIDIKTPVASMEAFVPVMDDVKSEDVAKPQPVDCEKALRVSEKGSPTKVESVKGESHRHRGSMPVKREREDNKKLSRAGRPFDRSRPSDADYERRRNGPAHGMKDGDKAEGRTGRVFKEERRMDTKETDLKPEEEDKSGVLSSQKRKEEEDSKQQEPVKRMRHWNSGNQLVADTANALTMGNDKEIMPSEIKKGPAVMVPRPPPKTAEQLRSLQTVAHQMEIDSNGNNKAVPSSTHFPSASLKIERFVRPFTLKALKDMLAQFGHCMDFWMDQIKTHCYVTFSKVDEAVAARNALYGKQWPPSFGNHLVADFVDGTEVKIRCDGSLEKANTALAPPTPRGVPNPSSAPLVHAPASLHDSHSNALSSVPSLRERQRVQPPQPALPVPTLEDLFRKTNAKPHIYYLPLSEEQVSAKLAAARNRDLQAKSRLVGRV